MAVELAVGYISLVADASQIPGAVDRALGRAGQNADRQGESIGRRMAAGLGGALKLGAGAAAAAAGGVIATALTKGLGRLTAIDDAQGKLKGLGHDAVAIQTIMDSALASVKGTAFGLGDAATVAAGAVAAGIKPGQELTKHLKLVADAATIAGVGIDEMGSIFNKVATSDSAQGDVINQLSDAGIPIVQLLAKEIGVTTDKIDKMSRKGLIDFATFSAAMQAGLGGAALESGKTVRGALANTFAALSRSGAAVLQPFFSRLAGGFGGITSVIDSLTAKIGPVAGRLDAVLFNKVIPQIQKMWGEFTKSDAAAFLSNALAQATGIISSLGATAVSAAPAVSSIAKSLASTAGTLGAGAWSVLVAAMSGVAQIASAVLVPALGVIAGLMSGNKTAVVALAAAFLAFKLIPGRMQSLGTALATMGGHATSAAGAIRGVVTAENGVVRAAGVGAVTMGRFGSAIAQLGTHVPAIARMQSAFVGSAYAATTFGRTAGTAAAAMSGMRTAVSGISGALGGPWSIALIAATVAVIGIAAEYRKASQQAEILATSSRELGIAQREMAQAFQEANGAVSKDVLSNLSGQIDKVRESSEAVAKTAPGALSVFSGGFQDIKGWFSGVAEAGTDAVHAQQEAADSGAAVVDSFNEVGLSATEMAQRVSGSDSEFDHFVVQLRLTANGGKDAEVKIRELRAEFLKARQTARDATPGFFTLTAAIKTLGDETASASDQLNAMKTALDVLAGKPLAAQEALSKYNEQVRETIQTAQEWDDSQGFGKALINNGQVDTTTANGKRLFDTLNGIRDATLAAGVAGNDLGPIFAKNDAQFQQLADAVGLSKKQIIDMAAAVGYLPTDIQIFAKLEGSSDVNQQLTAIAALLTRNREGVIIPAKALTQEARDELDRLKVDIESIPGTDEVRIIAHTEEALKKLQELAFLQLPDKTQKVKLEYDTSGFSLPVVTRQKLHENIDGITPRAEGGIDNLPSAATIWSPQTRFYQVSEPETGGEAFIPLAASKRSRSMGILSQVAEMFGLQVTKMADGGLVPKGVANALAGARAATGTKYVWGGTSTGGFDCSGFIGWLQQLLQGVTNPAGRLYTTMSLLGGAAAGLKKGFGPSGTYFQVGVNSEHMAATLNGQPVESGGSHGVSRIGAPAVGANDKQFTAHFYLPNELIDGIKDKGVASGSGKATKSKKKNKEWTEKDQIDLDQAALAVEQAKEDRDEVYSDKKKTNLDRQKADLAVREAQQKLVDKQAEKDGAGKESDLTVEEAPALEGRLSDDEISSESALLARDEARERRNEVYSDPESSDNDKRRADLAVQSAENAIDDLQKKKTEDTSTTKTQTQTISDRIKKFGADVFGIVFDAFKEQLPFGLGQSRWWDIPITTTETQTTSSSSEKQKTPETSTFPQDQIDKQLPVTPGDDAAKALEPYVNQAPASIKDWLKQLNVGVFDEGGWLKPGQAALNLSNRPEPIFNSPAQMSSFMGGQDLAPASVPNDYSVHLHNPTFNDGMSAVNAARKQQERQIMRHAGRP